MFTNPEQISAAAKSTFDAHLTMMTDLTQKAFASVEKLIELNLTVAKTSLEESNVAAKELLAAKDPQQAMALSAAQAQPSAEKALAYVRHVASIASEVQAEFTKAAEAQIAEASRKVVAMVDEVSKNAPSGSENAIAMFKSALSNATAGYEQFTRSTKQAVATMEGNVNNAVTQITEVAAKSTRARK